jgi:hypothetical protein
MLYFFRIIFFYLILIFKLVFLRFFTKRKFSVFYKTRDKYDIQTYNNKDYKTEYGMIHPIINRL